MHHYQLLYPSIRIRTARPVSVMVRVRLVLVLVLRCNTIVITVLHVSQRYLKDRVVNFHDSYFVNIPVPL